MNGYGVMLRAAQQSCWKHLMQQAHISKARQSLKRRYSMLEFPNRLCVVRCVCSLSQTNEIEVRWRPLGSVGAESLSNHCGVNRHATTPGERVAMGCTYSTTRKQVDLQHRNRIFTAVEPSCTVASCTSANNASNDSLISSTRPFRTHLHVTITNMLSLPLIPPQSDILPPTHFRPRPDSPPRTNAQDHLVSVHLNITHCSQANHLIRSSIVNSSTVEMKKRRHTILALRLHCSPRMKLPLRSAKQPFATLAPTGSVLLV